MHWALFMPTSTQVSLWFVVTSHSGIVSGLLENFRQLWQVKWRPVLVAGNAVHLRVHARVD